MGDMAMEDWLGFGLLMWAIKAFLDYLQTNDRQARTRRPTARNAIPTGYCDPLRKRIEDLAQDLSPPQEYFRAGRAAANNIFHLLRTHAWRHNINIARTHIAGSIGKGTAIWYKKVDGGTTKTPDFDCVVLINDQRPPFDRVLRALVSILKRDPRISILRTTNKTVQFLYQHNEFGQLKFDLLPATNYVRQLDNRTNVGEAQARLALEHLTLEHRERLRNDDVVDFELNKLHSSGLNEHTVQVINEFVKDEFILKVVRLAKYWSSNLNLGNKNFPARSCVMELIAIYAQQDTRSGRICLISGFRRFLEQMANFGNLSVSLEHGIQNRYNPNSVLRTVRERSTTPLIVEPTNYFYNLVEGISPEAVDMLESQAQMTLDKLKDLRNLEGYENAEDPIKEIFGQKEDNYIKWVIGFIILALCFYYREIIFS